jgi:putative redox protein
MAGRRFRIRRDSSTISAANVDAAVSALGRPLLVLHSPADEIVGIEHAERLFAAARHPKSLVALDGADHLLTGENAARWAGEILAVWAGRSAAGTGEPPPGPELAQGEVWAGGAVDTRWKPARRLPVARG